ncbi:helix-turn-helix domain-containing protein [Halomonas sp. M4R5S39]|uniref:MarR family transcriptional regulator n=1 Tax=Halomonas kalidii TaxID=3043293 RepID=UPI0024A9EF80|nr:helix-turn-helix domain-containing protein [Halomonas kalidii]MDI5987028.1 helix-turn-helix domain-containing protein [Halomonas kalidii]
MAKRSIAKTKWQGGYLALPKVVMEDDDFRSLPPSSLKVLMALACQYNGKNNGDLSATHSTMKAWGGMSHTTLGKALKHLQERRLVVKTRDALIGREGARCALYALSWQPIDPCDGKLDVPDTNTPPRRWSP